MPLFGLPPLRGRERSGREGLWDRECSGGEACWAEHSVLSWRTGGRGAAGRVPGGVRGDLPTEPSPTGRNLGTPAWKRPPIG